MATPHGIIFSREAILENLLAQKKAIRRKLALWEAQLASDTRKVSPNINFLLLILALCRTSHLVLNRLRDAHVRLRKATRAPRFSERAAVRWVDSYHQAG